MLLKETPKYILVMMQNSPNKDFVGSLPQMWPLNRFEPEEFSISPRFPENGILGH